MAVRIDGPKFYGWDTNGDPLAGGKLYTYESGGTSVPKVTYTGEDAATPNTNPVILNASGYADVYLEGSYNLVLFDADDNLVWSQDPVSNNTQNEWVYCQEASYVGVDSFQVDGNQIDRFTAYRAVKIIDGVQDVYSMVVSSSYAGGLTTVVIADTVPAGVTSVCLSVVSAVSTNVDRNSNTIDHLKTLNLRAGTTIKNNSYYEPVPPRANAGGGVYLVMSAGEYAATPDGYVDHELLNGNIAKLIPDGLVDFKQAGARGIDSGDDTNAINALLLRGESVRASVGVYPVTSLTVQASQSIFGDGMGVTVIKQTSTDEVCLDFPSYSGSEVAVELGGCSVENLTLLGDDWANLTSAGVALKNKTDITFKQVEVTGFGFGVRGYRDAQTNSCNQITFIGCRIRDNNISLYAPLAWNGLQYIGGVLGGRTWSAIVYDSLNVVFQTVLQGHSTTTGAVFLGGCSGFSVEGYFEGNPTRDAFVVIEKNKDVDGNTSNEGINMTTKSYGSVQNSTFSSSSGTLYAVELGENVSGVVMTGNVAGSGIGSALARLADGCFGNTAFGNHANGGTIFSYETPANADNNLEYQNSGNRFKVVKTEKLNVGSGTPASLAGNLVAFTGGDTAHLFYDGSRNNDVAGLYVNAYGYQGGQTKFRRLYIQDGKGNTIGAFFPDANRADIRLPLRLTALPTSATGLSSGDVWNDSGTLKIVP